MRWPGNRVGVPLLRREPPPEAVRSPRVGFQPVGPFKLVFADVDAAGALSDAWRVRDPSPSLRARRRLIATNLTSTMIMSWLSLYQTGTLRVLPELRHRWFDAGKVDVSAQAYQLLYMPDAPVAATNFAATAALAAAAGPDEDSRPWLRVALAAKVAVDAVYAAKLAYDQPTKHKALCSYCVTSMAITVAGLPVALREGRRSWRRIFGA